MDPEWEDPDFFDESDDLDESEAALVRQDLSDLANFQSTFESEGYRGVSVYCRDCEEEHYYPWDMLRENLEVLLDTGDTPIHEPAFQPNPEEYIPWEYARGYVDALQDAGVTERLVLDACPRCGFGLEEVATANFCPRCGMPLLAARLEQVLADAGLESSEIVAILRRIGLPT